MTARLRLLLAAFLLTLPLPALGAPASVTGIQASEQNGQVHVRWQPLPTEARISFYQILFSSQSIVQNGGRFEDFDIAQGTQSEHALANAPQAPTLYISVLAVNEQGEQSPSIVEEATVMRTSGSSTLPSVPSPAEGMLLILSAEAVSSTGVLLRFSAPVDVRDGDAPSAFVILDGSGQTLPVTQLVLAGDAITLHTAVQDPTKIYQLTVRNIYGKRRDGVVLQLDPNQSTMLFAGHLPVTSPLFAPTLPTPTAASASSALATTMPASAGVFQPPQLRAEADHQGQYTVEATWKSVPGSAGYAVSQTMDHGWTFSRPQMLPASAPGVRVPGVPQGEFGIRVQAVDANGGVIAQSTAYIQLGVAVFGPQPLPQVPLLPQQTKQQHATSSKPGALTQTGLSAVALLVMSGLAGGVAVMRRGRFA